MDFKTKNPILNKRYNKHQSLNLRCGLKIPSSGKPKYIFIIYMKMGVTTLLGVGKMHPI
jgi:hypothetical protein